MNAKGGASSSSVGGSGAAAWDLDDADDPADWNESFRFLKDLDATLRCDLCYNIFTAPVAVRDCNHIFCSVCVRNAINQPDPHGKHCPKCMRKDVYDSSLISQPLIERSAEAWKVARKALVEKQREEGVSRRKQQQQRSSPTSTAATAQRPSKRRRSQDSIETSSEAKMAVAPRRSARSASMRGGSSKQAVNEDSIVIDSDSDDEAAARERRSSSSSTNSYNNEKSDPRKRMNGKKGDHMQDKDYRALEASDLAECPLCGRQVTLIVLNQHLDKGCQSGEHNASSPSGLAGSSTASSKWFQRSSNSVPNKARRLRSKLARPNYSVMKEVDIKKLLTDSDLPKTGSRDRLTERHRQWVTLYNANLDASEKVQKRDSQLRRDLEEWERGQEESQRKPKALNEEASRAYTISNGDHFRELLQTARESHAKNKAAHQKSAPPPTTNGQSCPSTQPASSSPVAESEKQSSAEH